MQPVLLKTAKVINNKGSLRKVSQPREPEEKGATKRHVGTWHRDRERHQWKTGVM